MHRPYCPLLVAEPEVPAAVLAVAVRAVAEPEVPAAVLAVAEPEVPAGVPIADP